ncbi:hypothetical protein J2752_000252 [Halarchaeum rubridurum]|uniref:Uncharacterized protein n=1 Tax=Halarchaeum rubridurum TaxID=489911 RepID=A0A830FYZ9_9EURY|nr:hypothetical protein [Halarchaeum rubridurum]MBP1953371.1 hypothetical protein [Halarchaeum rubridurum]GGM65824.1 hypothetical protein GCM10009017_14870 [Halarchaeum rubridurum]
MATPFARLVTAVQYQITLAFALVLLPVATLASRLGVTLPLHRLIERSEAAYESAR